MTNPYQAPDAFLPTSAMKSRNRIGLIFGLLASTIVAAGTTLSTQAFQPLLADFGADLPLLTEVLLAVYPAVWLLPGTVVALWLMWRDQTTRSRIAVGIGLVSLFVVVPTYVVGLYLPIFKLASVVG